jgi:hypothetical protein
MINGFGRRPGNRGPRLALGPHDADLGLDRRGVGCGRRDVRFDCADRGCHRNLRFRN